MPASGSVSHSRAAPFRSPFCSLFSTRATMASGVSPSTLPTGRTLTRERALASRRSVQPSPCSGWLTAARISSATWPNCRVKSEREGTPSLASGVSAETVGSSGETLLIASSSERNGPPRSMAVLRPARAIARAISTSLRGSSSFRSASVSRVALWSSACLLLAISARNASIACSAAASCDLRPSTAAGSAAGAELVSATVDSRAARRSASAGSVAGACGSAARRATSALSASSSDVSMAGASVVCSGPNPGTRPAYCMLPARSRATTPPTMPDATSVDVAGDWYGGSLCPVSVEPFFADASKSSAGRTGSAAGVSCVPRLSVLSVAVSGALAVALVTGSSGKADACTSSSCGASLAPASAEVAVSLAVRSIVTGWSGAFDRRGGFPETMATSSIHASG